MRTLVSGFATVCVACGGSSHIAVDSAVDSATPDAADKPASIAIELDRHTGDQIEVTVHVTGRDGQPDDAAVVSLTAGGGTVSAVANIGSGAYFADVTPDAIDTEVAITASADGATATRTALVLSTVDSAFGQPEALDGLVNSPGWEDGANVSPDGQWLIVSSYVPIDLLKCVFDGNNDTTASCLAVNGPVAAPARPNMLGAERVHGATFDSICPDLGITQPIGPAFFPIAAYAFHRQPDGSFAEPHVIGFDADGCLGPYGMSFATAPSGNAAAIVFANGAPSNLWWAPITLGQDNILGTYRYVGSQVQVTGFTPVELPPMLTTRQGNPSYGGGYLWWDDEDLADTQRVMYAAPVSGTLPAISAGSAFTVGVAQPGHGQIQPFIDRDGRTLLWMQDLGIARATLAPGADPALAASWSAPTALVGAAATTDPIFALGEPTLAHLPDGTTELYFVYLRNVPGGGYDANVGRVRMH